MDAKAIFHCDDRRNVEKIVIQCKSTDKMSTIFQKFAIKVFADVNDFEYYYLQIKIDGDLTLTTLKKDENATDIDILFRKKLKIMKCPLCIANNAIIEIKNYKLNYYDCRYGHKYLDQSFFNYNQTQNISLENIICFSCKKTQKDDIKEYKQCLSCSFNFGNSRYYCDQCCLKHDKDHKTIKYDEKNYYCKEHFSMFNSYCKECKLNLCDNCLPLHQNHNITKFEIDINPIKKDLNEIKEKIKNIKAIVNELKHYLDEGVKIIETYYNIAKDITEKYELFNTTLKNYQVIKTINLLSSSNKEVIEDLKNIVNLDNDWEKKFKILYYIYKNDRNFYFNQKECSNENESKKLLKNDKKNSDYSEPIKIEIKKKINKKNKNNEKDKKDYNKKNLKKKK